MRANTPYSLVYFRSQRRKLADNTPCKNFINISPTPTPSCGQNEPLQVLRPLGDWMQDVGDWSMSLYALPFQCSPISCCKLTSRPCSCASVLSTACHKKEAWALTNWSQRPGADTSWPAQQAVSGQPRGYPWSERQMITIAGRYIREEVFGMGEGWGVLVW